MVAVTVIVGAAAAADVVVVVVDAAAVVEVAITAIKKQAIKPSTGGASLGKWPSADGKSLVKSM